MATLREQIHPFAEASKAGEHKIMTRAEALTLLDRYKDNFEEMKGKAREVGEACDTLLTNRAMGVHLESVVAFRADDMPRFDNIVDALTETCKWMDEAADRVDIFRKIDEVFDKWVKLRMEDLDGGSPEDVVVIDWDWESHHETWAGEYARALTQVAMKSD